MTALARPATPGTGGHALARALLELDVRVVYGLPGVHNLGAWAAIAGSPIRLVGVRHEQTAVYAADGAARVTGTLGVAITTTGPGAANALAATGEAYASGSPVLIVATDIATTLRRPGVYRGALHETRDQAAMFAPVVKQGFEVASAAEIAAVVQRAAAVALSAPTGPVYVQIPTDLLNAPLGEQPAAASHPPGAGAPRPMPAADLERAAALIAACERPLIWAGGGAVRACAGAQVAALAARIAAPVLETYMGRGLIGVDHPSYVGLPPHVPEAGGLWDAADLVVAIGSDFDGMTTQNWAQPPPPAMIAVNVDAADATKNYPADVVLEGDAALICERLCGALEQRRPAAAAPTPATLRERAWARLETEEPEPIRFLQSIHAALPDDTAIVADMCIPGYWIGALHPFGAPRLLAYPMGWGTLGFGFPASIGAAIAHDAPVLAVCGDGGFLFACGELATIAQEQIPLTVLIVDDGAYGMLRYDQREAGDEPSGMELQSPDFVILARSFGIEAEAVDGVGDPLRDALARQLAHDRPSVVVARASMPPPPTTSPRWYRVRHDP